MADPQQRRRNTLSARRRRASRLAVARSGRLTCPFQQGRYGVCGGRLEDEVLRDGRVVTTCPRCERRLAGICRDCNQPVVGRIGSALRCAYHKRVEKNAAEERWRVRLGPVALRAKQDGCVARRNADPVRRARFLATKRLWRERNVVKIKLEKRRWRLEGRPGGWSTREKYEDYHRRYRAEHAVQRRALAKRRYYELHPDRPHPICACGCDGAIPWDGNGRPAKWLRGHSPWPHALTPKETLMKATERAIQILEQAREKTQAKLAGIKQLEAELSAIDVALDSLRPVVAADGAPAKRGGRKGAKAAA